MTIELARVELPHWYAALVADAVEHALSEADWQDHGAPKLAAWILGEFGRLAENLGGAAANPQLVTRIASTRENVERLGSALQAGLRHDAAFYQRLQSIGDQWFVERTVELLGLRFESPALVAVPRAAFAAIEATVQDAFTRGENVDARLLETLERAGIPALFDRLRAMNALQPTPAALLAEGLPLATVLSVEPTDDPALERVVFASLSSQNPRTYRPAERFAVGESIEHTKLGRGVVVALGEGKIRVRFADGERTLVHAPG